MKPSLFSEIPSVQQAKKRFWILSDLQQANPEVARRCMHTALDDVLSLNPSLDGVCYLGDSTEGANREHLEEMAEMQVQAFGRIDAPVFFVMGNHETDYHRRVDKPGEIVVPFRERILKEPQWHTTERVSDWSFSVRLDDLTLFFLSDRIALPNGEWFTSHCMQRFAENIPQPTEPHDFLADAVRLRNELDSISTPFFTFSHYCFPGGNRDYEGPFQSYLLPLPQNAVAHFYGHSHVGDKIWGRENVGRQISSVNLTGLTQFDVASLEDDRGTYIRSAFLEWYGDKRYAVFFRNHSLHTWDKVFFERQPAIR